MSRICALFTLLAIAILGSRIGFASEMKIEDGIPSPVQQTVKDQYEKTKHEKVKAGIYRDLKWFRKVKLSALDYVYPDYAKFASVLYKYEPAKFIDVVKWKDLLKEVESGALVLVAAKGGEYIINDTQTINYEKLQFNIKEVMYMKVFLSTMPVIFNTKPIGKVVSWKAGVPVTITLSND